MRTAQRRAKGKQSSLTRTAARITAQGAKLHQVFLWPQIRPAPAGGWLELNATAAGRTLEPIPQGQDVLIVIGEGLDKAAIEARLKACIINTKTTEW